MSEPGYVLSNEPLTNRVALHHPRPDSVCRWRVAYASQPTSEVAIEKVLASIEEHRPHCGHNVAGEVPHVMPTDAEPLDLEAIKKRAEEATPGPWEHVDYTGSPHGGETFMGCGQVVTFGADVMGGDIAGPTGDCYPRSGYAPFEDMAFIAAARSDVPALVAEVERLHQEILRLKAGHADLAAMHAEAVAETLKSAVERIENTFVVGARPEWLQAGAKPTASVIREWAKRTVLGDNETPEGSDGR